MSLLQDLCTDAITVTSVRRYFPVQWAQGTSVEDPSDVRVAAGVVHFSKFVYCRSQGDILGGFHAFFIELKGTFISFRLPSYI